MMSSFRDRKSTALIIISAAFLFYGALTMASLQDWNATATGFVSIILGYIVLPLLLLPGSIFLVIANRVAATNMLLARLVYYIGEFYTLSLFAGLANLNIMAVSTYIGGATFYGACSWAIGCASMPWLLVGMKGGQNAGLAFLGAALIPVTMLMIALYVYAGLTAWPVFFCGVAAIAFGMFVFNVTVQVRAMLELARQQKTPPQ